MFVVHLGGSSDGFYLGGGGGFSVPPMFFPMLMGGMMQCKYCGCMMDQQLQGSHEPGCPRAVARWSPLPPLGPRSPVFSSSSTATAVHTLYRGTSRSNGLSIVAGGFRASSCGQLGAGVDLADETKATGFANTAARRGLGSGAIVLQVCATCARLKGVSHSDQAGCWAAEGYDDVHA